MRKWISAMRWWEVILLACFVFFTATMSWWQLSRYDAIEGNARNLGYALQWPAFGILAIIYYVKFVYLRREQSSAKNTGGIQASKDSDCSVSRAEAPLGAGGRQASNSFFWRKATRSSGLQRVSALPDAAFPRSHSSVSSRSRYASPDQRVMGDLDPEMAAYNSYLAHLQQSGPSS